MKKTYIIAEAGDNHNGNIDLAFKLVDKAKEAGADCVKFQTFVTEEVISKKAKMADYQINNIGKVESQFDMVKKLELSFMDFIKIKEYCDKIGITFISTPFDLKSIDFLNELNIKFWKIPSGEITNLPFLEKIGKTKKEVVLSTGMSNIIEIKQAVEILKRNGTSKITILHCNTEYPTPMEDVNLNAMLTIKKELGVEVGYSDHTLGIEVPIAATALGATIIEKHFTLDKNMEGPDHKASLEPNELKEMVRCIRNIDVALGNGIKEASKSEKKNIAIARKSIVARTKISKGEMFTENNLAIKRPGNGISPMRWYEVLGAISTRDFDEDENIEI